MNTNIVAYLIKKKGMTQTDIASKLKSADKDTLGVSQALVSKWNRGEKIPKDREIEMLKLADLYWELEDKYSEDDDFLFDQESLIDSRWNIIVKTEQNQEDWYNFFKDMLTPKQFLNMNSEYKDSDFVKFVRGCVFNLNDAGFLVPENPELINNENNLRFFNLLRGWMHRVTILQKWCSGSIPYQTLKKLSYAELYNYLPRIALAQIIIKKDLPERTDKVLSEIFIEDTSKFVESTIRSYMYWGEDGYIYEEDFNEILIHTKSESKDVISKLESNESENIDASYLSYAERKILDQLNAHEKLMQELNQKIDFLIDQENDIDGIPF
tara:strand:- start:227 stop:1201 length:975 start_codon:yes stop_codon:yes gene_type:complete